MHYSTFEVEHHLYIMQNLNITLIRISNSRGVRMRKRTTSFTMSVFVFPRGTPRLPMVEFHNVLEWLILIKSVHKVLFGCNRTKITDTALENPRTFMLPRHDWSSYVRVFTWGTSWGWRKSFFYKLDGVLCELRTDAEETTEHRK
jgi:hypothetical protein